LQFDPRRLAYAAAVATPKNMVLYNKARKFTFLSGSSVWTEGYGRPPPRTEFEAKESMSQRWDPMHKMGE